MGSCILSPGLGGCEHAGYINDGLVFHIVNPVNANTQLYTLSPDLVLYSSELTIELCYRADSAVNDAFCGLKFGNTAPCLLLNFNKTEAAQGADYGLTPIIEYTEEQEGVEQIVYTVDAIPINNLSFGDIHTYTIRMYQHKLECFFDGVKTPLDHSDLSYIFNGSQISVMYRTDASENTTGKWFDVRVYDKALTDADIRNNYVLDHSLYS